MRRRKQRRRKAGLIRQFSEAVFQRFDHSGFKLRAHGPDRHRPRKAAFVGIRYIKVVFEPGSSRLGIVKDGNPGCPTVDPTPEPLVPAVSALNRQDGSSVRALGKNKHLLVKGQAEVAAGGR
ncbi:MAG: hypothetical protein V8T29_07760 [Oscillospiraceae bacterium]